MYTKVGQNIPAPDSEGWTIVLMERASRFLWELQCGRKDQLLLCGTSASQLTGIQQRL